VSDFNNFVTISSQSMRHLEMVLFPTSSI